MLQTANQFSFLLFVVPSVLFGVVLLLRYKRTPLRLTVAALMLLVLGVGYFLLRPGEASGQAEQVEVLLVQPATRPVLLEIYSNYCIACLRAEPVVDSLQAEWGDSVEVVRLNIHEPRSSELAARFNFQFTPTFILFTPDGEEVWRQVGGIDAAAVRAQVEALLQGETET